MVIPFVSSTQVLGPENLLHFPHSPAFHHPPADLVPFHAFRGKGLFVPLPLTVDGGGVGVEVEVEVQVDGAGIPTVDLENDHARVGSNARQRQRRSKGEVVKVARQDAWRLGRDATWVEPEGTYRGGLSSEDAPWDRVMRALSQFVSSRSYSYGKAYISHDVEFRLVAGLQHAQSYDPHIRGNVPVRQRAADGEWIAPTQDEEASPFIRDMVGTFKAYWIKVMGDAHGRIHRITAKESFEIINSFLHYLAHYRILASDPYLAASLATTLALSSSLMLAQISIAQRLCDALPGAVTPDAWHALVLDAWLRGPMRGDADAWERHGKEMTRRVEAEFTEARQESMQRNILDGLVDAVEGMAVQGLEENGVRDHVEGEPRAKQIYWRAATPDRSAEQAIRTLSSALGTDAAAFKTRRFDVKEYTIAGLSATQPVSLPAARLDVCFARAHAARADDLLWLRLVSGAEAESVVVVVLVDGKGLDGIAEDALGLATGMRIEAGLMIVGEDEAETPVVCALERVAPMFPERAERSDPPEV